MFCVLQRCLGSSLKCLLWYLICSLAQLVYICVCTLPHVNVSVCTCVNVLACMCLSVCLSAHPPIYISVSLCLSIIVYLQRNAFANDLIPVENYIDAIQMSHLATLSSKQNDISQWQETRLDEARISTCIISDINKTSNYFCNPPFTDQTVFMLNSSLKHALHALVRFCGNLIT